MKFRERYTDLVGFFQKYLIVFAQCNTEDDGGDVFEAMDPFLPLTALSSHVEHATSGQLSVSKGSVEARTVYSVDPW
jgi:hypothetical protein